ncbi:MAG: hypothetical protein WCK34_01460 [Bacteroidota bacterium]
MQIKKILVLFSLLAIFLQSMAQGDLLITPTRVVFDGNKQKEELNLVNIGKDTAIYSISFLQFNMKEDGGFEAIEKTDSGQMFADPYLRIFPRKVTLAPREPQVISLQCRRKPNMASGEYRSHLYFRAEKEVKPLGLDNSTSDSTQLKVQLIPIYGISIPIIIRTGAVNVGATLGDLALETRQDSLLFLKFNINRTGNISIYGDFTVEYIPVGGKSYEIGNVKGVGVYTNINKRVVSVKLHPRAAIALSGGKMVLKYTSAETNKTPVLYAQEELIIK